MHVLDLVTAVQGGRRKVDTTAMKHELGRSLGDAGQILDAQARQEYRQRITDLAEELEEAKRWDDLARAASLQAELEAITRELASGVGLGGRHRKAAAVSELARISVTKAIRAAIQKIGENDPSLGHTLAGAVTTGSFCSYSPHPENAPFWEL